MQGIVERQSTDEHLVHLWGAVLGRRFRELPSRSQTRVIAAIGCDDAFSCPLVEAYNLGHVLGAWSVEERAVFQSYGVTEEDYKAFLAWNDHAQPEAIAACQAWLRRQQEDEYAGPQ